MKKMSESARAAAAEKIALAADRGENVMHNFRGEVKMVQPIQRVNLDLSVSMLRELDRAAEQWNVSRQAVIKALVRQGLDNHYSARKHGPLAA